MDQFTIDFDTALEETPDEEAQRSVQEPPAPEPPSAKPANEPHILTVSEITALVKGLIDRAFTDVWVVGEVSNFRNQARRHYYFTLKDDQSQLAAVIFNGPARVKFDLADGLELVCHGSVTVYGPRGQYQIIIDECFPKGKGALQLAFEQLKKKLDAEGLFRPEHKKRIPFLPRKVGVVTSPTGAAVRDIIHVLTRRYPAVEVLLYPVKVQGEGAAAEIAQAVAAMNRRDDIDVLIVGRGGGSLEDLWAFNEEVVARAIFASHIPVISAVGHEIDFTIADFVADVRAPTPSAAAEIAVPVMGEVMKTVKDHRRQLMLALANWMTHAFREIERLKSRIPDPRRMIPDLMMRVDSLRERLIFSVKVFTERREQAIRAYLNNLKHLSPLNILEKGYAVVRTEEGLPVRDAARLAVGQPVDIMLHAGSAGAVITRVSRE